MRMRQIWPVLFGTALLAQVSLTDLPNVARGRAERQRPAQLQALEPFWADLALEYRNNAQFLDQRITQAAALGDSVVPLLLEKLQPSGGEAARHLAGNCRRVLERLDPASFVEALVELANGRNDTGREEAIRLLGHANTPTSIALLGDLVERTTGEERRAVLRSLRLLKAAAVAPRVVGLLGASDRQLREDVLNYLVSAHPSQVVDTVLQALGNEKDHRLLPTYVEYFAGAVREHDAAARGLLALIGEKLDWQDTRRLVQVLASVAPKDHEPTVKRLTELLDTNEVSALAVQAAVTLRALGERNGVTKLKRALDEQLRKPQRKREANLYEQRANLNFAIEEFAEANADFEKILEYSDGLAMSRRAHIGILRCEAHRRRWANLTKAMKASGLTVAEIEALGAEDPVFQEALAQDKVRTFLQALAKEQGPK